MKRRNFEKSKRQNGERPKRPWLRRVGVVVGCLFVGAIINVLVAWGCVGAHARSIGITLPRMEEIGKNDKWGKWLQEKDMTVRDEEFSAFRVAVRGDPPGKFGFGIEHIYLHPRMLFVFEDETFASTSWEHGFRIVSAGWPLYCFRGFDFSEEWGPSGVPIPKEWKRPRATETLVIRPSNSNSDDDVLIPYGVLHVGMIINTLLYGAVIWLVLLMPFTVQRVRRSRRNRCPDCGYDLRGADHGKCPECGEAVAGKRQQPNSRTARQVVD